MDQIAEWFEAQPLAQRVQGSIPLFGLMLKEENLSKSERTEGGLGILYNQSPFPLLG